MSESERSEGKDSLSEVVSTPKKVKPTREQWLQCQLDYETGNFKDLRELSERYNIDYTCLRNKVYKNNWKPLKNTTREKVTQLIEKKAESKVELLFAKIEKKAEKYERMVELSQQSYGSLHSDGTPVLDADVIETYSKTESRIIEWNKLALGISDKTPINVDLNINVTAMLAKLREGKPMQVDIETEVMECKALIDGLQEG